MVILDVIPLLNLPRNQPDIVSYFHTGSLPPGTLVEIAYHHRKARAVVVGSASIKERKLMFKKQADFTLKNIEKVLEEHVPNTQLQKAQELSKYYLAPLGMCLKTVLDHPDEKDLKKYIAPGKSKIAEALYAFIPEISELETLNLKLETRLIDMRKEIRDANFSIFSRALKEALQIAAQENEKLIIYIPRRGYANLILCKTCGHSLKCPNCSVSLILHDETQLRCHHCGYKGELPKTCPNCKGYNLKPWGVGIEKIETELVKFLKNQNIAVPKIKQFTSETKKFPADWQFLLTTQSIFKYRKKLPKISYLGIINADVLTHIPDYRAEEMLFRQTYTLATIADKTIIQTYNPEDPALVAISQNDIKGFWDRELGYRKDFTYPPFAKLVRLTYRHRSSIRAIQEAKILKEKLAEAMRQLKITTYQMLGPYASLVAREQGLSHWNLLFKIPADGFDLQLRNKLLQYVPGDWMIDVDPLTVV